MTKEVKMLRSALEKCFTESTVNEPVLYEQALYRICGISRDALKQADAVNGSPSEEDKRWLKEVEARFHGNAFDDKERAIWQAINDLETGLLKLKHEWGME